MSESAPDPASRPDTNDCPSSTTPGFHLPASGSDHAAAATAVLEWVASHPAATNPEPAIVGRPAERRRKLPKAMRTKRPNAAANRPLPQPRPMPVAPPAPPPPPRDMPPAQPKGSADPAGDNLEFCCDIETMVRRARATIAGPRGRARQSGPPARRSAA